MISITLTGEEAVKYLGHLDAIDSAYDTIADLQAEIATLQKGAEKHSRALAPLELKGCTPPDISTPLMKHLADQKVKQADLEAVKRVFPNTFSDVPKQPTAIIPTTTTKWTDADVRQLQSFPDGPPSKRSLEHVCKVFPDRSENAIRNKLNQLGIRVKAGTLVWKK